MKGQVSAGRNDQIPARCPNPLFGIVACEDGVSARRVDSIDKR